MAKRIQLFDFCKNGATRAAKSYDFAAPLAGIEPVGLNSFSCSPLLAHRSATGGVIFSQFNQNTGAYVQALLETANDSGITGTFPSIQQCLPYGANIAGLRGATPVVGSASNPFPTSEPNRTLFWSIGGAGFTKVVNGVAQDLGADATAFDRDFGLSMVGFGGTLTGSSGGNTLVKLPPDNREYVGQVRLRANHNYIPFLKLPYVPSLQALRFAFDATYGYYIIPDGAFGISADNGTCQVEGSGAPVCPCLLVQNGDLGVEGSGEHNGPSLTRQYNFFRLTPFAVPPFNGTFSGTFDVPRADCRAFMTVYADSSRVDNVTCHEGSGGSTGVSLPVPTTGPPPFNGLFPGLHFDTVYQFAITGSEATYTFDVTHGATTLTTTPATLYDLGKGSHVRAFECFIDMHKSGNPGLVC